MKRFEVTELGQAPLPPIDLDDTDLVIGSAAGARVRIPGPHAEHVRVSADRWHALAELTIAGARQRAGTSGTIPADGVTFELGAYTVRVTPLAAGVAPSAPQRTESLARELVRKLLGADAAPSLTITRGPTKDTAIRRDLAPPESRLVIGRGDDADWIILDEDLSRLHAEIRRGWDGVFIRDLDSKNGTFIDGAPVERDGSLLYDGAVISIGNMKIEFRDPAERHLKGEPISPDLPAPRPPPKDDGPGPSPWPFIVAAAIVGLSLAGIAWIVMT